MNLLIRDPRATPLRSLAPGCVTTLALLLAGCQTGPAPRTTQDRIGSELKQALADRPTPKVPEHISAALLPPLAQALPRPAALPEQRFDLVDSNATVQQVYHAMASGSRYSILLPPTLAGTVSVNLKEVTMREALEVMREVHGFEYRIDGTRVYIQDATLQTRIFQVSYPSAKRTGRSDTKVISGSITSHSTGGVGGTAGGNSTTNNSEGSQIATTNDADFWKELDTALKAIVGTEGGRQVVMSQHTGTVVVRALPKEQREIESFLRSARLSIERQVMLEAKIVEVSLKEGFESGINWAGLSNGNHRFSVGADPTRINVPGSIGRAAGIGSGSIVTGVDASATPPTVTPTTLGQLVASPFASGGTGLLGVAFTTSGFNGLLSFLETQGSVQVLSSPRVAAVNNQKAVLRVGTDDFFITNISTTTVASASGNVTTPTITVQPFFSGIALDVTPQIDEDGMVTMHVRPSVSEVSERTRIVNLGTLGSFTLPLASSNVNETDTVVRVQDGYIVAIGGLMQQRQTGSHSQVPGAGDIPVAGNLFKRTDKSLDKRELVFLIKPTVIKGDAQWREDIAATDERMNRLGSGSAAQ